MRTPAVAAACAVLLASCASPGPAPGAGTSPLPASPLTGSPSVGSPSPSSPAAASPRPSPAPPRVPPVRDPAQRYEVTATVLENRAHGPQLCVGGVAQSLPPQCGGVPVEPFSWDRVEGEESTGGTTWATVRLVGTFDGTTFHPTEPPRAPRPERHPADDEQPLPVPCPTPAGGWRVVDDSKASDEHQSAVVTYANGRPDVAGVWLAWPDAPADGEPYHEAVLVLAFTGDLDRHRRAARERWGGPLCVTELPRGRRELARVQEAFSDAREEAAAAGVHLYSSSLDEVRNVVTAGVLIADEVSRRWVDERFGRGWVELDGALRAVG